MPSASQVSLPMKCFDYISRQITYCFTHKKRQAKSVSGQTWRGPENECFQKDISLEFSTFAGVWCIAIAAIGFLGNFLTLIAIPYASKKRR